MRWFLIAVIAVIAVLSGCLEPDPVTHLSDPCGGLGLVLPPGCG